MKNVLKRLAGLLAAAVLVLGMAACSQGSDDGTPNPSGSGEAANEKVAKPEFSVAAGEVTSGTSVTITCTTSGAEIYYTTDGSTPSSSSTKYTAAISITAAKTIKAIAVKNGMTDSDVAEAAYTIKSSGSGEAVNVIAGKSYYFIKVNRSEYTDDTTNNVRAECVKVKVNSDGSTGTESYLLYEYKNGAVSRDNVVIAYPTTYTLSGSTVTAQPSTGNAQTITLNADGTATSKSGSKDIVFKPYTGDIYGFCSATLKAGKRVTGEAYALILNNGTYTLCKESWKSDGADEPSDPVTGSYTGNTVSITQDNETITFTINDDGTATLVTGGGTCTYKKL